MHLAKVYVNFRLQLCVCDIYFLFLYSQQALRDDSDHMVNEEFFLMQIATVLNDH
jgi:hypothetical protein